MLQESYTYTTRGNVQVSRRVTSLSIAETFSGLLPQLDSKKGAILQSSYEYPGRYKRWAIGFVDPPLEITTKDNTFVIRALNDRGQVLVSHLDLILCCISGIDDLKRENQCIRGKILPGKQMFQEENRSRQPSVFSIIRSVLDTFHSDQDSYLGLYGAFGYNLIFQFESVSKRRDQGDEQRDIVLYLPDHLFVIDNSARQSFELEYEFDTETGSTKGVARCGEVTDFRGERQFLTRQCDHQPGEYAELVKKALRYFRQGDLFEVVPSQSFFRSCNEPPSKLFETLLEINPSPYSFMFNLGGEYLIGASPEMFVRVDGRRVETCPISGTIRRGQNAIEDASRILELLNSKKDEAELTMCTDVDRNDKSRICDPGSVRVIGRRQVELYSHLIHTVDHVEGFLCPEFDGVDAFLTHTWAVTVTGAPKRAAVQFIEENESSSRRWYGGAVGSFTFNGSVNTGLVLRTIRLKDSIAEIRVGATLLYDSQPEAEEEEIQLKATAMLQALHLAQQNNSPLNHRLRPQTKSQVLEWPQLRKKVVLLIDYEDSFVHTLANYIRQTGARVITLRHGFPESVFEIENPDLVVLSPGPGRPSDFNLSNAIQTCVQRDIPLFGVCLGLQGIVERFGGELSLLPTPQHGKASEISVTSAESFLFEGLPQRFVVGRYHSLCVQPEKTPSELVVTAISEEGVVMAIEHKVLPIAAVQFHPESIMTLADGIGLSIIHNVIQKFTKLAPTERPVPVG
ncbi:anthranilate synthase [Romeria aff. gracilis LEGE 07310]|uniref:Anthranilate synthase n=1 Tax=Vasconcelosia minhoensis LEGE 07310 TaxID=915328 RepID=A0A8J7A7E4_9CYAN|nr:anthranilate synthase [Romeria aff. gracilis LEGE 07310]